MDDKAKQASRIIDSVATALANWVVTRQAELDPDLHARFGADWRNRWVGHVESQLRFLAQAVAVRRPQLFTDATRWTKAAFRAHQVSDADLLSCLRCMQEVLQAELPKPVAATTAEYVGQAIEQFQTAARTDAVSIATDNPHRRLVLEYLEAVLDGRRDRAEQIVLEAVEGGLEIRDAYELVLRPAQVELGNMWHAGEIGIADEHFGSATTESLMAILRNRAPKQASRQTLAVCAAVGGELHEIGLRMVADFFEMDGWTVIYLGANTPATALAEAVGHRRADLLLVSASTSLHVRAVGELLEQVRENRDCAQAKVILGGPPFSSIPDLWMELGADGCATSATEALQLGNDLVPNEQQDSA